MKRILLLLCAVLWVAGCSQDGSNTNLPPAFSAHHEGEVCEGCHAEASAAVAPKVVPKPPDYVAGIWGENAYRGHKTLACNDNVDDGVLTGCHNTSLGYKSFLATDTSLTASSALCWNCHKMSMYPGVEGSYAHHPATHLNSSNEWVLVTPTYDLDSTWFAPNKPEPFRSHPDSLVLSTDLNGTYKYEATMPLATFADPSLPGGVAKNLVVCTTCHNPHYGSYVNNSEKIIQQVQKEPSLLKFYVPNGLVRLSYEESTICRVCH